MVMAVVFGFCFVKETKVFYYKLKFPPCITVSYCCIFRLCVYYISWLEQPSIPPNMAVASRAMAPLNICM